MRCCRYDGDVGDNMGAVISNMQGDYTSELRLCTQERFSSNPGQPP